MMSYELKELPLRSKRWSYNKFEDFRRVCILRMMSFKEVNDAALGRGGAAARRHASGTTQYIPSTLCNSYTIILKLFCVCV